MKKHKQIVVLMSDKEDVIHIAIKRLKRINGLYMNILGLEGRDDKDHRKRNT